MSAIFTFSRNGTALRHLAGTVGLAGALLLGAAMAAPTSAQYELPPAPGAGTAGTVDVLNPNLDSDADGLTDVAEASRGTNAFVSDTDGDGLSDGQEVSLGFPPLSADPDGDGVNDAAELAAGTSPFEPNAPAQVPGQAGQLDTDGDGLFDSDEAGVYGTDPNVADSDGDGSVDGEEIYLGTDPLMPNDSVDRSDSDGDGLFDLDETSLYGTDASAFDTDGDGAGDGEEVYSGTNPILAD